MKIYILLITSLLFFITNGESEWKKRKDKSGIVVYTRTIEGEPIDEFKALVTLENTTLMEVLDVIMDVENYPQWISDCTDAEILFKEEKYHDIHYFTIKAPWPVSDRDAVYEITATINTNNTFARVDLKPRGNYIAEKKHFVRLYKGIGFWELEEIDARKVEITYQFLGEPGGKVPAWLANSFVVTNPYQTLSNLKDLIEK